MKQVILIMTMIIGLFSFTMASNTQQEEGLLAHEEEMIIELDQNELATITNEDQRDFRYQQKQEIKIQILELYKELKEHDNRTSKKETRNQINQLKKELRKRNSKIAHSYKLQLKRFFGLE